MTRHQGGSARLGIQGHHEALFVGEGGHDVLQVGRNAHSPQHHQWLTIRLRTAWAAVVACARAALSSGGQIFRLAVSAVAQIGSQCQLQQVREAAAQDGSRHQHIM